MQRFQIMVWPDFKKEWQLIKTPAPKFLVEQVIKIFEYLDQLTFDHEGKPIFLEFSQEAQVIFDGWQCLLENRTRANELPAFFEAHLAKYKKLVPTLALIFDFIWEATDFKEPTFVGTNAIRSAIVWAEYLESHAEKIYGSSINQVAQSAKGLLKRLKNGQLKEPFTARDVYHGKHWSGLATAEEVQEAISYLCELNYLKSQLKKTGGKASTIYWVHPDVFKTT